MNEIEKKSQHAACMVKTPVLFNERVAENYYVMRIQHVVNVPINPGQFFMVEAKTNTTDPLLKIPLSVHMVDHDYIELLYRVVGKGTELLSRLKIAEEVTMIGPLGQGFMMEEYLSQTHKNCIFIAGGCGIAPLYFLAETLALSHQQFIHFFMGAAKRSALVKLQELKHLGVHLHVATDDGSWGHPGYITELVKAFLEKQQEETYIFACGAKNMLKAVLILAEQFHCKAQFSMEAYMACGFGVCLGCAVQTKLGYKLCCKDGPVFNAKDLIL